MKCKVLQSLYYQMGGEYIFYYDLCPCYHNGLGRKNYYVNMDDISDVEVIVHRVSRDGRYNFCKKYTKYII